MTVLQTASMGELEDPFKQAAQWYLTTASGREDKFVSHIATDSDILGRLFMDEAYYYIVCCLTNSKRT